MLHHYSLFKHAFRCSDKQNKALESKKKIDFEKKFDQFFFSKIMIFRKKSSKLQPDHFLKILRKGHHLL